MLCGCNFVIEVAPQKPASQRSRVAGWPHLASGSIV